MPGLQLGVTVGGADAVRQKLAGIAERAPGAVARALYQQGMAVWAEAVRRAPVEFGVLRSSGYASPPITDGESVYVQVGFGVKYAIYQHEGEYNHPRGGERHYLRNAVQAQASLERIAAWATENLAKGRGTSSLPAGAPRRPNVVERARARSAVRRTARRIRNKPKE